MKGKQFIQSVAAIAVVVAVAFAAFHYVVPSVRNMMRAYDETTKIVAKATGEKVMRKLTETVTLYNQPSEIRKDSVFSAAIMDLSFTKVDVPFKLQKFEDYGEYGVIHATCLEPDVKLCIELPVHAGNWGQEASLKADSTAKNKAFEWCAKIQTQAKPVASL